jgi:hypothetical protein
MLVTLLDHIALHTVLLSIISLSLSSVLMSTEFCLHRSVLSAQGNKILVEKPNGNQGTRVVKDNEKQQQDWLIET